MSAGVPPSCDNKHATRRVFSRFTGEFRGAGSDRDAGCEARGETRVKVRVSQTREMSDDP